MRKLITAALLLAVSASAQNIKKGGASPISSFTANCIPKAVTAITLRCSALSDDATTVTSTEPIAVPAGSISANAIQIGAATQGFFASAAIIEGVSGGVAAFAFSNSQINWPSSYTVGFTSGNAVATQDTILTRKAAANFRFGAADLNGVPVAQTLSVQNAITGSNLVGSIFTLAGSLGTGTGLPAPVSITGADQSVATGATAQTGIHRLVVGDTKNLTTGAATTVLSIPLATLQMAGATITYHMEATDGTNQCTRDGVMTFSAENSAGVFVTALTNSAGANDSTACTATKTLTEAWAVTSANPALVQVTPTLTGITATRFSLNYSVVYGGNTQPTL